MGFSNNVKFGAYLQVKTEINRFDITSEKFEDELFIVPTDYMPIVPEGLILIGNKVSIENKPVLFEVEENELIDMEHFYPHTLIENFKNQYSEVLADIENRVGKENVSIRCGLIRYNY